MYSFFIFLSILIIDFSNTNIDFQTFVKGDEMDKQIFAPMFYYGSMIAFIIAFIYLSDKKRLKELFVLGLLIAVENYTVEIILLHLGYYSYPLSFPGYPQILIISSVIIFPIMGMLYYQYLSDNMIKNIYLTIIFVSINMSSEVTGLYLNLFIYQKGLTLFGVFCMYLSIYILINLYRRLKDNRFHSQVN